MTGRPSPRQAWNEMLAGNARFVAGSPEHPRQDVERRSALAAGQTPTAALFGCADSRVSAEILFDAGLGDLFVVRNAGQVVSESVIGSLEYAVLVLGVPLVVVLAHDACGAVNAAIDSTAPDAPVLPPHIRFQISPIVPAVGRVLARTGTTAADVPRDEVGAEHLRATVGELLASSELISEAVAEGRLALVGANYRLAEGTVDPQVIVGDAG